MCQREEEGVSRLASKPPTQHTQYASEGEAKVGCPTTLAGRGSYGSVYKARVHETGEIVAVKIIPLTEQDEIGSIQKEVAVLRDCNHPNVVKYYVSGRQQGLPRPATPAGQGVPDLPLFVPCHPRL